MPLSVLIMGLPGSGKTTLATAIHKKLVAADIFLDWLNADVVRAVRNDWDFSDAGRERQAQYMHRTVAQSPHTVVLCDFIAPTQHLRDIFNGDILVWVDTIKESRYADTNAIFEPPTEWTVRVTEQDCDKWADIVITEIMLRI